MIEKNKKLKISSILFLLLLILTFYIIFKNNDFNLLIKDFKELKFCSIILCFFIMCLYFYLQALYMKYSLKSLDEKITIRKGIFYSIVEFFFSAITPSSTGGQPIQLYYMTKDKIPVEKSVIVLMLNTIIFKLFFIISGLLILIFNFNIYASAHFFIKLLFILGLVIDIIIVLLCYLLMFNQTLIKKIIKLFSKVFKKVKRNDESIQIKIDNKLEEYLSEARYIKSHKKELIVSIIITFIQRICMFSIVYIIYRGLSLNSHSYVDILSHQLLAQICIEGIVLPGGTGAIESISNELYKQTFGKFSLVGMLLNRGIIFYIPLIISLIIIIITTKKVYLKKKKV